MTLPSSPKRIVIFLPPTLGDSVHHTCTLSWIKASWPGCHLAVVTGGLATEIIENCDIADEIIDRSQNRLALFQKLKKGKFDLAFFPYVQNSMQKLSCIAGIPTRIGLQGGRSSNRLTCAIPVDSLEHQVLGVCARLLRAAGGEPGSAEPQLRLDPASTERFNSLLPPDRPHVAIMTGASHARKQWDISKFNELASRLADTGFNVVSIGGLQERGAIAAPHVIDLAGKLSAIPTAALLTKCQFLVTNDTGAMHLAGAVGTPVIALFGPSDPVQFAPPGSGHQYLRSTCPCALRNLESCSGVCLDSISVEDVWKACNNLIRKPNNS